MISRLVTSLTDIALKPDATKSTSLLTTRRICRAFSERLESIRFERRIMKRKARKLRKHQPHTAKVVEKQAANHRRQELADLRAVLGVFGRSLILDMEGFWLALGFDRVCDLLNINIVERDEARALGLSSVADLVFAYALEDSATHRGQECNGSPLHNACHLAMAKFIQECPEDQLPNPFAPGALLGPKIRPQLTLVN